MKALSGQKSPKLLARTPALKQVDRKATAKEAGYNGCHGYVYNHFKSAQWTPDGTSVITSSADNTLRTFIIPPDLLQDRDQELPLEPYAKIQSVEAVRVSTVFPLFDLQDSSTTLILCSSSDHPIRLHSALSSELVASYPFVNASTEAYISPHSLLFTRDGQRFVSGSTSMLALFDVSRPGQGPFSLFQTASGRKASKTYGSVGMKGIVSALSIEEASNVLAAGTFSRHVGLYDAAGQGECLGVFRVDGNEADSRIGGKGITQLMWSPCGRYLHVVERHSNGVMIYDIRKTGQLLSWIEGRQAETNQRLGVDLSNSTNADGSLEIWAGGLDGNIRVWRNAHSQEGSHQPHLQWRAHNDAVSSTAVHSSGTVVASCSGQRHFGMDTFNSSESDESSDDDLGSATRATYDNSLKLFAL